MPSEGKGGLVSFETKDIKVKEGLFVRFLYHTPIGRCLLRILIMPFISKAVGAILSSPPSRIFIGRFIRSNHIDIHDYKKVKYTSFNDFFIREIKEGRRPIHGDGKTLISPCDGKLTAYQIDSDGVFKIKHAMYDLSALLRDEELAREYERGLCLIFRLTPDDYHRYCFIDDGEIIAHKRIAGVLHTVRPIAVVARRYKVYSQNTREYTVMKTRNFDQVVEIEVGAMLVGKIDTFKKSGAFSRGEERGMFEFGGSTIILLFKENSLELDPAIFDNTAAWKETVVKRGCALGK